MGKRFQSNLPTRICVGKGSVEFRDIPLHYTSSPFTHQLFPSGKSCVFIPFPARRALGPTVCCGLPLQAVLPHMRSSKVPVTRATSCAWMVPPHEDRQTLIVKLLLLLDLISVKVHAGTMVCPCTDAAWADGANEKALKATTSARSPTAKRMRDLLVSKWMAREEHVMFMCIVSLLLACSHTRDEPPKAVNNLLRNGTRVYTLLPCFSSFLIPCTRSCPSLYTGVSSNSSAERLLIRGTGFICVQIRSKYIHLPSCSRRSFPVV